MYLVKVTQCQNPIILTLNLTYIKILINQGGYNKWEEYITSHLGPAVLPEEVLKEATKEMLNYENSGMSVMEMSHRSSNFQKIIDEAEQDLRFDGYTK